MNIIYTHQRIDDLVVARHEMSSVVHNFFLFVLGLFVGRTAVRMNARFELFYFTGLHMMCLGRTFFLAVVLYVYYLGTADVYLYMYMSRIGSIIILCT